MHQELTIEALENYEWQEDLITDHPAYQQWYKKTQSIYQEFLTKCPHFRYREYQVATAAIIPLAKRHIIAFSMSLGKTSIALMAIKAMYKLDQVAQVHIAVPNQLSAHRWLEEAQRLDLAAELISTERQLLRTTSAIIIYTHDFVRCKATSLKTTRPTISRLLKRKYRPSMVVVDEVHHLGNSNTLRYKHLVQVWSKAKRGVALSGTVSDYQLSNLHTVCKFVYGSSWPYTRQEFNAKFCIQKELSSKYCLSARPKFIQHLKPDSVCDYYDLMRRHSYRLSIDDVKASLVIPDMNIIDLAIEPTEEHARAYSQYIDANKTVWQNGVVSEVTALQLLHPLINLTNSPSHRSSKLQALTDHLVPKTVIFCHYKESIRYVINHLESNNISYVGITGDMDDHQRLEALHSFQNDPRVNTGVFSLSLTSESIDLTQAKRLIFYCLGWSNLKLQQAVCRAVRPGNPNATIDIVYPYHRGMIDQYQYELMNIKQTLSNRLLNYDFEDQADHLDTKPSAILNKLASSTIPTTNQTTNDDIAPF